MKKGGNGIQSSTILKPKSPPKKIRNPKKRVDNKTRAMIYWYLDELNSERLLFDTIASIIHKMETMNTLKYILQEINYPTNFKNRILYSTDPENQSYDTFANIENEYEMKTIKRINTCLKKYWSQA
jgi:hypothetical protein